MSSARLHSRDKFAWTLASNGDIFQKQETIKIYVFYSPMIATEPLILMQKGYQVEELKEPESLIIIKGTAKAVKAKHVQDVIQADSISAIKYGNLKKSSKVSESDHNAIEKFECREQLALGEEVSEKDILLWNGGTLEPVLKRFEIVNESPDNTQLLDEPEFQANTGISLPRGANT